MNEIKTLHSNCSCTAPIKLRWPQRVDSSLWAACLKPTFAAARAFRDTAEPADDRREWRAAVNRACGKQLASSRCLTV
jgi:hypothetical protein